MYSPIGNYRQGEISGKRDTRQIHLARSQYSGKKYETPCPRQQFGHHRTGTTWTGAKTSKPIAQSPSLIQTPSSCIICSIHPPSQERHCINSLPTTKSVLKIGTRSTK